MKVCPNCQLLNREDAAECADCKFAFSKALAFAGDRGREEEEIIDAEFSVNLFIDTCPRCGNPGVRKVSAVYGEGSHQNVSSSVGTIGFVGSESAGSSEIARRLAPPVAPLPPISTWGCILGAIGFRKPFDSYRAEYKAENDRLAAKRPIWERCYYCPKCDNVSDPANGRSMTVSDFAEYVS